ncbi:MAG: hypothetical protein AAFQ94_31370, partial [Bacteroidota bacterium]
MKVSFNIAFVIFIGLNLYLSTASAQSNYEEQGYTEIGTYVRKWIFIIPLYEVKFYMKNPELIVSDNQGKFKNEIDLINSISDEILDSNGSYNIVLTYEPLLSLKNYKREKPIMISALERAGMKVDDEWEINGD